jgi:hypothetical protein
MLPDSKECEVIDYLQEENRVLERRDKPAGSRG